MIVAAFLLSCVGGVESNAFHPARPDLFMEVPDVSGLVSKLGSAPAGRFVDDPDVQKLGALTQQLGYDLGALVRSAAPRLSDDPTPGPLFAAGDLGRVAISWSGLDATEGGPRELEKRAGVMLVCDFASEAGAQRMTAALRAAKWLVDAAPQTEGGPAVLECGGEQLPIERHHLSALFLELDSWSTRQGTRWILGAGTQTPEHVSARLAGKEPALAAREVLFASEQGFTPTSGTTVLRIHSDLATIPFLESMDDTGLGGTLLTSLVPFVGARGEWRIELRGDRFVTESSYVRLAATSPFDALQARTHVEARAASFVPKEAVGAWVTEIVPEKLGPVLESLLTSGAGTPAASDETSGATSTPKASAGSAALPNECDARIAAGFAKALGSNAAIAMLPITSLPVGGNGSMLPRMLVTFELRDKEAFTKAFEEFKARLQEARPKLEIEERPYHKIPITVFTDGGGEERAAPASENPLAGLLSTDSAKPCVVVLGERVLVTLSPTHARSEIQRYEKQNAANAEPDVHPLAAPGRIPSDAIEASTLDWSGLFGKLYDVARGFAPMLAQGEALPFDPATLPASGTFTRFFQPSYSWTKLRDGQLYTYSESSFGPETPITLAAVFAGISRTQGGPAAGLLGGGALGRRPGSTNATQPDAPKKNAPSVAAKADVTKPAPVAKDESREKTLAALRSVKTGIAVYRSQTGHVPVKLADLLTGTDSFPKGFLDPAVVPQDAWSHELRYTPEANGAKYKLWSLGPDGVDQEGAGDDVLAP